MRICKRLRLKLELVLTVVQYEVLAVILVIMLYVLWDLYTITITSESFEINVASSLVNAVIFASSHVIC